MSKSGTWFNTIIANAALLMSLLLVNQSDADGPEQWFKSNTDGIVKLYLQLHKNPELSFQEKETCERIAKELKAIGADVTSNVGGYGVVGILKNGNGPTVMLRRDLDGLPIVEQTGQTYASTKKVKNGTGQTVGVMHACGHDIHMACFVGTARYLAENKEKWKGTLMLIGQPAEERGSAPSRC